MEILAIIVCYRQPKEFITHNDSKLQCIVIGHSIPTLQAQWLVMEDIETSFYSATIKPVGENPHISLRL